MADKKLFRMAIEAKTFMHEVGEGIPSDELIMRATVAYNMLLRVGFRRVTAQDGEPLMAPAPWNDAYAIALIAHGFEDHPPCTPERAELFSTVLSGHLVDLGLRPPRELK